jgi:hypothetical protein
MFLKHLLDVDVWYPILTTLQSHPIYWNRSRKVCHTQLIALFRMFQLGGTLHITWSQGLSSNNNQFVCNTFGVEEIRPYAIWMWVFINGDICGIVEIMKPLMKIKQAIGAKKWVTISTVCPILYNLWAHTRLKHEMLIDLQKRYSDDIMLLLSQAAFLDRRLKTLPFLSLSERSKSHREQSSEDCWFYWNQSWTNN